MFKCRRTHRTTQNKITGVCSRELRMILKKLSRRFPVIVGGLVSMLSMSVARAEYELNMTQGVTPISRELYSLHMLVFWICVVIGIVLFGTSTDHGLTHNLIIGKLSDTSALKGLGFYTFQVYLFQVRLRLLLEIGFLITGNGNCM